MQWRCCLGTEDGGKVEAAAKRMSGSLRGHSIDIHTLRSMLLGSSSRGKNVLKSVRSIEDDSPWLGG